MKLLNRCLFAGIPTLLVLFFTFFIVVSRVIAWESPGRMKKSRFDVPVFPSCPVPSGEQVARYDEGWHWIVGNPKLQWGSDTVYKINPDNYVQCYCPKQSPTGENDYITGIQTNWLKADSPANDFHAWLVNHGWMVVTDGADFNLASGQYFAKNIPFNCRHKDSTCDVVQSNQTSVFNFVSVTADTGGNRSVAVNDGDVTISTGTVTTNVEIFTSGGYNSVTLSP